MDDITLPRELIERSLQHIENCAEVWDDSGVSRSRAITRTAQEIRTALAAAPQTSAQPCPHVRSTGEGTHWCALAASPQQPSAEPSPSERAIRRILGRVAAGHLLYTDDGECSDASQHPSIDFLRDSPKQIQAALRARKQSGAEGGR